MKKVLFAALLVYIFVFALVSVAHAQSASPQDTLNQYVSDLQNNPGDSSLREKIIKLVQTIKPSPQVPEDAERHAVRGQAALKDAKDASGYNEAIAEFEKASLLAPWAGTIYYNLGIVQNKAGKYAEAIKNLKLYLLASPGAPDVKKVKDLIFEVEYRQEKAKDKAAATEEMWRAIRSDDGDAVRAAIDRGANVNDQPPYTSYSALTFAAKNGEARAVRALLDKGADVNFKEPVYNGIGGDTALMFAARRHDLDIVRALIEKRADVNARNPDGVTALTMAVSEAAEGWTAELAAKRRREKAEIIRILKAAGARD